MCFCVEISVPFCKQKFNLFFKIIQYITKVLVNDVHMTCNAVNTIYTAIIETCIKALCGCKHGKQQNVASSYHKKKFLLGQRIKKVFLKERRK